MYVPRIQLSGDVGQMDNYICAIAALGGEAVPGYAPAPDLTCDGLILCGGGDIEPSRYGQEMNGSFPPDLPRDEAEFALIEAYMAAGKPILGICRGMQMLNVALGGDMIQHLPDGCRTFHCGREDKVHPVRAAEGSVLYQLYGKLFAVNSYHHQAVGGMGRDLIPTAWTESGVVEALEHTSLPILGVQYHPERTTGDLRRVDTVDGGPFLAHFLDLCRKAHQ